MSSGITLKDVSHSAFIPAYAAHLKRSGKIEVPKWVDLVKTGTHKQLAPYDADWFFVRCAAVARHIYLRRGVGVGAVQKRTGGLKNRGNRPSKRKEGSGSVARKVLQALESLGLIDKEERGGRKLTEAGRRELDRIAVQVVRASQE
ncbi:Protein component of the small (40S) ribosomal subunit [Entomophthora muscae]|uniref:Protein component of the small (40S) ribosomal subunit n=3 Tax=Entomophthora muscae TaxID=34485 RepID=A0ACC2RJM4_9FUNG|nr:Protein component of the small (40S) ribosomal subunit [Entomophthora muscae]KAJ9050260.1 Protein component of the small (40S) ribosomal subunit, variant 2 [Entomophthora muscae]KAJ9070378.1 Protein component of the small (40S) ribosomal subunit [Entomophthora muscae]